MTFLIVNGERYALPLGDTTLGGDADEVLRASPLASFPPFAVVTSSAERTSIRALGAQVPVMLGGQQLGAEPRALRHGDCFTVGGMPVHVGELRNGGRTAHVSGVEDRLPAGGPLPGGDPTSDTGGCLTVLADGRAHPVPKTGLVIGRDPDCDIVLTAPHVSRRHARVMPGLLGYTLVDESANGVTVNGARVDRKQLLSQGDVIHIGDVALQFSADLASYEPDAAVLAVERTPLPRRGASLAAVSPPPTAPAPVAKRPGSRPAPAPALLATLEVLEGSMPAGTLFRIERPVVQLGRGPQNDVQLADESVSAAHATLVQRGASWQLLDLGSRNGTYVEDRRITECALSGPCELRLGSVTLLFRPIQAAPAGSIGTLGVFGVPDARDA
jgi:pSer/pThr/pTyr-binding forkhead associated (FHA) protein